MIHLAIGQAAKVAAEMIRFYERRPDTQPRKPTGGGGREYDEGTIARLCAHPPGASSIDCVGGLQTRHALRRRILDLPRLGWSRRICTRSRTKVRTTVKGRRLGLQPAGVHH